MFSWFKQNKKPLAQSLLMFLLLFTAVALITWFYDFSNTDLGGLLFLTALLCCVFIAKNTFDMARAAMQTKQLESVVAKDVAFSSTELYMQLYKNSPIPYILIDKAGEVQSANIAAVRLLGVTQTTVNGVNVFLHIQTVESVHLDLLVEKYHGGVAVSGEMVKVVRPDHREVWALLSLFGFTNTNGEHIGLLTLVDITKQKKAEDAKSEFVSLASHQLRTPIAGMKWSVELLLMDGPDSLTERQHKYIDRLMISIRRLAVLVDDFLRVSRFELGTFQAEYTPVNVYELFEDVVAEQAQRSKQKGIQVKTFYDQSIDVVITDANLLRMIVTNLFSNAVKYTKENGTIHVGLGYKGDNIIISVADNGMGIPIEDQDNIFSKLFRANNAARNVPDGTGLGLYIVKEAVAVLGGNVTFTSAEDVGTTFEVVLPLELPYKN